MKTSNKAENLNKTDVFEIHPYKTLCKAGEQIATQRGKKKFVSKHIWCHFYEDSQVRILYFTQMYLLQVIHVPTNRMFIQATRAAQSGAILPPSPNAAWFDYYLSLADLET